MTLKEQIMKLQTYKMHEGEDTAYVERDDVLKALEQEPCYNPNEWCHDCKEYDHNKHCCPRYNKVIRSAVEEMKQEPCEDAVSRQAAIDAIKEIHPIDTEYDCTLYDKVDVMYVLEDLPSVQPKPKTGHWISYWDEEARCYVYKCPECGNKQPFDTKCCWECGTRLIEPQESEET